MSDSKPFALKLYNQLSKAPFGQEIFSRVVSFKAPYFASISPKFIELRAGYAQVVVKKRRKVTNHLGTVHAIAMANAAELCAGTMIEATLDRRMRWIPKEMKVSYLKKAKTDITATASIESLPTSGRHEIPVVVSITDTAGAEVCRCEITMMVSEKTSK